MLCSRSWALMARNAKRIAERREKRGEDSGSMRTLYHGMMYMSYSVISDGTDHEIDKAESDYDY